MMLNQFYNRRRFLQNVALFSTGLATSFLHPKKAVANFFERNRKKVIIY